MYGCVDAYHRNSVYLYSKTIGCGNSVWGPSKTRKPVYPSRSGPLELEKANNIKIKIKSKFKFKFRIKGTRYG